MRILTRCLSSHAREGWKCPVFERETFDLLPEVSADGFRLHAGYNCRQGGRVGLFYCLQASKMFEKTPGCALAYAGDLQ